MEGGEARPGQFGYRLCTGCRRGLAAGTGAMVLDVPSRWLVVEWSVLIHQPLLLVWRRPQCLQRRVVTWHVTFLLSLEGSRQLPSDDSLAVAAVDPGGSLSDLHCGLGHQEHLEWPLPAVGLPVLPAPRRTTTTKTTSFTRT